MFAPSGDHLGAMTVALAAPTEVNCAGFDPSASHTQISRAPDRLDTKAILLPSSEYVGIQSNLEEDMNWTGLLGFPPGPGKSTRQMLVSLLFTA